MIHDLVWKLYPETTDINSRYKKRAIVRNMKRAICSSRYRQHQERPDKSSEHSKGDHNTPQRSRPERVL